MRKRITIISGIQVTDNPRVLKEANELARLGYEVEVLASIVDPASGPVARDLAERNGWKLTAWLDRSERSLVQRFRWQFVRMRKRLADELYLRTGRESAAQLGYVAPEMLRHARANPAHLYSAHLYQGIWVGRELLRRGAAVGVDFEDWYSDDLLPDAQKRMPMRLIRECEQDLLRQGRYALTTSTALSEALAIAYAAPKPAVLYNTFPLAERNTFDGEVRDRRDMERLSVFWFSQTIGPGRGLELLAAASHQLRDCEVEFHLRGTEREGYPDALREQFAPELREHVHFHSRVPHEELFSRIAEHDLGFAAEQDYCQSRRLTITNKILQYLLAGVPALATDTPGQSEVQALAGTGVILFPGKSATGLAAHIATLANDRELLANAKAAALRASEETFCWEKSTPILSNCVEQVLATN
jgi:glycosyltransferase involved in cell wall biosynthesis